MTRNIYINQHVKDMELLALEEVSQHEDETKSKAVDVMNMTLV